MSDWFSAIRARRPHSALLEPTPEPVEQHPPSVSVPRELSAYKQLGIEVARRAPALPILREQLQEAAGTLESSVNEVCGGFMGIVELARANVGATAAALGPRESTGQTDDEGMRGFIGAARLTFDLLLTRVTQSSQRLEQSLQRLGAIEKRMDRIFEVLEQIDDLCANTKLLSVNASIEAARLGTAGKGFAVVAGGISELGDAAREMSELIGSVVCDLRSAMNTTCSELRTLSEEGLQHATLSRLDVDQVLYKLNNASEQMQSVIAQSAHNGEVLASEISRAVSTLQFQDAVNQRIGHVVHALEQVEGALFRSLHEVGQPVEFGADSWAAQLAQQATMAAERRIIAARQGIELDGTASADGNVELF